MQGCIIIYYTSLVNASVCRNRYNRVEQTCGFLTQLRTSAKQFVDGTLIRVKRGSAFPLTPKTGNVHGDNGHLRPIARSRKQLKMHDSHAQIQMPCDASTSSSTASVSLCQASCSLHVHFMNPLTNQLLIMVIVKLLSPQDVKLNQ